MTAKDGAKKGARQLLHLVFGGELTMLDRIEFSDLKKLDIVGIYPNYAQAYDAWKDAAPHRGRCPYALLHRASAPVARS
jgi:hypothetical protein